MTNKMSDQKYVEEALGIEFDHLSDLIVNHVLGRAKLDEPEPDSFRWHIGTTLIATAVKGRNKNDAPEFQKIQFTKPGRAMLLTELEYRLHNIRKRFDIEV